MGRTSFGDIPGNVNVVKYTLASVASNGAAATYPIVRVPYNAKVVGAHLLFTTSRAVGTKGNALTLVNLGTDGTGTVGLGTHQASAAYASYSPLAITLTTSPTVAAGGVIGLVWSSHSAGTTVEASEVVLHLTYI